MKKTKEIMKRILTMALAAALVAGSLSAPVYADELSDDMQLEAVSDDEIVSEDTEDLLTQDDMADPDDEDLQMAQDPDTEELLSQDLDGAVSEDLLAIDEDAAADTKTDNKAAKGYNAVDPDGKNYFGYEIPATKGNTLRFFGDGIIQKRQHIYFGHLDESKFKYKDMSGRYNPYWRVLDNERDNDRPKGKNAILLMSERLWGEYDDPTLTSGNIYGAKGGVPFSVSPADEDMENLLQGNTNDWIYSNARDWCYRFYENSFTDKERNLIRAISKEDDAGYTSNSKETQYHYGTCELYGDPVFCLSVDEMNEYCGNSNELNSDWLRRGTYLDDLDDGVSYWLRTPSDDTDVSLTDENTKYAMTINYDGPALRQPVYDTATGLHIYGYRAANAMRPAFNIETVDSTTNKSTIIFASEAWSGKTSNNVGAGALYPVDSQAEVTDWRLTLADSSRDGFTATSPSAGKYVRPGGTINISYSGAQNGNNEYVSALLLDKDGNILYYGRIVKDSAKGTASLTIPKSSDVKEGQTYKIMVFSEQYNGDIGDIAHPAGSILTDLASDPRKNVFSVTIAYNISKAALSPTSYNYDGASHIPAVKHNGNTLTLNKHYTRVVTDSKGNKVTPVYGGTFTMTLNGKIENGYYGSCKKTFRIIPWNVAQYTYQSTGQYNYTGTAHLPSVIFSRTKKALKAGTDYTYVIKNSKGQTVKSAVNAGSYSMIITGRLGYTGSVTRYFKINPIANTLNVTKKTSKSFTFSASKKTKKLPKNKTIEAKKIYKFKNKGVGKITYSLASVKKGSENFSTFFKVNNSNGKVTVRAGAKKGTYTVKVNVTAAGNVNYKPKTQQITFKIKIK